MLTVLERDGVMISIWDEVNSMKVQAFGPIWKTEEEDPSIRALTGYW